MESTEEDQPEVFQLARMSHDRFCCNRLFQAVIERLFACETGVQAPRRSDDWCLRGLP